MKFILFTSLTLKRYQINEKMIFMNVVCLKVFGFFSFVAFASNRFEVHDVYHFLIQLLFFRWFEIF